MAKLNNASSDIAKQAANKMTSTNSSNGGNSGNTSLNSGSITSYIQGISVKAPGDLLDLTPDNIASQMPKFDPNVWQISDPLKPPTSLPQATKEEHTKGIAIYEGAGRAADLWGAAYDVTAKKFNVVQKQAKAVSAGVKAATSIEATKGDVLDYMKQVEVTDQKKIAYGVSNYTTRIALATAPHTAAELDQKLEQAKIKAEDARLKTAEKQQELMSFKQQLGQLSSAN